jgi:hypothetical protein
MADELKESKTDPTPEDLTRARLPDPLPPSEREVYEGKLAELKEELADVKSKLEKALKPAPSKKGSLLSDYCPL